jgi:hypothetical protein
MSRPAVQPCPPVYELSVLEPFCPSCDYNLRGTVTIAGARCPECGAALPFDRLAYPQRLPAADLCRLAPVPLVMLGLACGACLLGRSAIPIGPAAIRIAAIGAVAAVLHALGQLIIPDRGPLVRGAFAIVGTLVVFFATWQQQAIALLIFTAMIVAGGGAARRELPMPSILRCGLETTASARRVWKWAAHRR